MLNIICIKFKERFRNMNNNIKKPVIIVVDDVYYFCEALKQSLKSSYEVHTFTIAQDAVNFITKNPVDLVLLDYEMPGMTGYEVLMAIRLNRSTNKTPVIFLTGETNERMKKEMLDRGASDYLCKPINYPELHKCIKKHL